MLIKRSHAKVLVGSIIKYKKAQSAPVISFCYSLIDDNEMKEIWGPNDLSLKQMFLFDYPIKFVGSHVKVYIDEKTGKIFHNLTTYIFYLIIGSAFAIVSIFTLYILFCLN